MEINKFIEDAYYRQPQITRFIWTEILAIKSVLVKKGLITVDEIEAERPVVQAMLDSIVQSDIEKSRENATKANVLFKLVEDVFKKKEKE